MMYSHDLNALCADWLKLKELERRTKEIRRGIEDQLILLLPDAENHTIGDFNLTLTPRTTHKVNSQLLNQLAQENGLTDHIPNLFWWRPELNLKQWTAADPAITGPLLPAITTTANRIAFHITKIQTEKDI